MKFLLLIFSMIFFCSLNSYGQINIVLEHKSNPEKLRKIKSHREYIIKTDNTIYYSTLVGITDSALLVLQRKETDPDSAYSLYQQSGIHKDSNFQVPNYYMDTLSILLSEIQYISKPWFKNTKWLEPFGWLMVASVMAVGLLPFAVVCDGMQGAKDWAEFEAILVGVSFPISFIGTRQTKYDLQKKWTIKNNTSKY
jgi:hypothetical protein